MIRLIFVLFVDVIAALFVAVTAETVVAQDHSAHHMDEAPVRRPKIYLDKSEKIVQYQLKRLSNAQLLLVETATDDAKYVPVYRAILLRSGMAQKNRDDALRGLTAIHSSDVATELLAALKALDANQQDEQRVGRELSKMLLNQSQQDLQQQQPALVAALNASGVYQWTGIAGLLAVGSRETAWEFAAQSDANCVSWLSAVSLVPAGNLRNSLRGRVVECLSDRSDEVRTAAIRALANITSEQSDSFAKIARLITSDPLRNVAVRSLLKVPVESRPPEVAAELVEFLVGHAESTPAAERTTDDFLDAMQLADELLGKLDPGRSKHYRDRLRSVTVRVVRLHTVEEEMRYDKTHFAVEAGQPVQIVLDNEDLMPHNVVITKPGRLKDVALAGAALGTTPGRDNKLYVPKTSDVLFATAMVNAGKRARLTFTAPSEPGEYPYVCTFPRHWTRMYGVMVVVSDLDAWQRAPVRPADPLGNTREFVNNWVMDDFDQHTLAASLNGRSRELGKKLFKEATCLGCHRIGSDGGTVGPELSGVLTRWKGDYSGILREVLQPSYRIDPKYAVKIVIDVDGRTTSGIVKTEDRNSISILVNPEVPQPKVIQKKDIENVIPSTVSMMPKALLDKFTQDEILEILNYITSEPPVISD